MKNVLVVYQNIQHYRIPIFKLLMNEKKFGLNYTIAADVKSKQDIVNISESFLNEDGSDGKIQFLHLKNYWFRNILWQSGLIRASFSRKYDTIIFLGIPHFITTWLGCLLANLTGKKTYFWAHAIIREDSLIEKMKKLFFKLPKGLLLYGEKSKARLVELGFNPSKITVIYNSLDYDQQIKMRSNIKHEDISNIKKQLFKNELPILLFIGRLTPQKKLDILINLIEKLHADSVLCNLLFIGEGSEKDGLIKLVQSKKLTDFCHFFGACYKEETNALLISASDLCISPGEVGLTAMHSLVYGTPVITHDSFYHQMPEYEAIISGFNGDLFSYNNFESLYLTVKLWLQNNGNRDKVRENCYQIIEQKYNPHNQVKILRNELL